MQSKKPKWPVASLIKFQMAVIDLCRDAADRLAVPIGDKKNHLAELEERRMTRIDALLLHEIQLRHKSRIAGKNHVGHGEPVARIVFVIDARNGQSRHVLFFRIAIRSRSSKPVGNRVASHSRNASPKGKMISRSPLRSTAHDAPRGAFGIPQERAVRGEAGAHRRIYKAGTCDSHLDAMRREQTAKAMAINADRRLGGGIDRRIGQADKSRQRADDDNAAIAGAR